MEEKIKIETKEDGTPQNVKSKIDNFLYYYKWHTIVAAVILVVIAILVFQTASRTSYDGYILYAGPYEIKKTGINGDIDPYSEVISSLKSVCYDFDNDNNVNVALQNLFVLNEDEANKLYETNPGQSINSTLVKEDSSMLSQTMMYGDYYVCFLSERLYNEYVEKYSGALFCKVGDYLGEGEYELANEWGVYLSSLGIYSLPGICDLPPDTVVCLRALSEVSQHLNKNEATEAFRRSEIIFENILSYVK